MALVERGLGAKRAHAKSQSAQKVENAALMAMVCVMRVRLMRVEGSMRQAYPLVASVTELIVGLRKRESNQPRPGVAPGDPQHEAEGWTWCPRGLREYAQQVLLYGKDPAKMTYSRMDLIKRGLFATAASAKSQ